MTIRETHGDKAQSISREIQTGGHWFFLQNHSIELNMAAARVVCEWECYLSKFVKICLWFHLEIKVVGQSKGFFRRPIFYHAQRVHGNNCIESWVELYQVYWFRVHFGYCVERLSIWSSVVNVNIRVVSLRPGFALISVHVRHRQGVLTLRPKPVLVPFDESNRRPWVYISTWSCWSYLLGKSIHWTLTKQTSVLTKVGDIIHLKRHVIRNSGEQFTICRQADINNTWQMWFIVLYKLNAGCCLFPEFQMTIDRSCNNEIVPKHFMMSLW